MNAEDITFAQADLALGKLCHKVPKRCLSLLGLPLAKRIHDAPDNLVFLQPDIKADLTAQVVWQHLQAGLHENFGYTCSSPRSTNVFVYCAHNDASTHSIVERQLGPGFLFAMQCNVMPCTLLNCFTYNNGMHFH